MPLWVLEVCFVNAPPVIQAFPWERHALVWLPERTKCPRSQATHTGAGLAKCTSSASSSLDFWVKSFQLHAGIFDAELPIDTALFGVRLVGPSADFHGQRSPCTDATSTEAWARQAAQLAFRAMQPTAVCRGIAKLDPFSVRARAVRCKGFIERALGGCVEVVTHECHRCAVGIARIQDVCDCDRPGGLGPS